MDTQSHYVPPMFAITKLIGRQMKDAYETEAIKTLAETLVAVVATTATLTLSMSCFTGVGLKPILDSFKNIQVIVHYMLIDSFSLASCELFFSNLLMISNVQVFDPT